MDRRQLAALFFCLMAPPFVANCLLPLLPVYVRELGADPTLTGIYLSFAFGALAAGTIVAGWLSNRFQARRSMIILNTVLMALGILMMGVASDLIQLTIATMIVWFAAGIVVTMVNILTGLLADPAHRGRTFGIVGLSIGIGVLLAGLIGGPVVDRWGFGALFIVAALSQPIQLVAGFAIKEKKLTVDPSVSQTRTGTTALGIGFWFLLIANLLAQGISLGSGIGRPLFMDSLGYDASAITSTVVATGLITFPLPFIVGVLSDRFGRRQLLMICFAGPWLGMLLLAGSSDLWHFWLSAILVAVTGSVGTVGSALVTDLVPPESLDKALAQFGATPWIGGVIGYTGAGLIIQSLGMQPAFFVSSFVPLVSILLIFLIRPLKQPAVVPAS